MKIKFFFSAFVLLFLIGMHVAAAATVPPIPKPELLPGPSYDTQYFSEKATKTYLPRVLGKVATLVTGTAAVFAVIFLIVAGIRFMLAAGNEEGLTGAKKMATWSLLGLLISLFAFAIVSIIVRISFGPNQSVSPPQSFISTAYAQNIDIKEYFDVTKKDVPEHVKNLPNPSTPDFFTNVIKILLGAGTVILLGALVASGVMLITAQGNEEQLTKAKQVLIYSLVGVAIVASAYALVLGLTNIELF